MQPTTLLKNGVRELGVSVESKLSEKQVGLRFGRRPGATTMLAEQG
jgi:hypothetical protein